MRRGERNGRIRLTDELLRNMRLESATDQLDAAWPRRVDPWLILDAQPLRNLRNDDKWKETILFLIVLFILLFLTPGRLIFHLAIEYPRNNLAVERFAS